MFGAPPDHGEVNRVDYEAIPISDVVGEARHLIDRKVDGPATHLAHQMMVFVEIRQMDDRRPVTKMHVVHRPALGQGFQRPIDGGGVDPAIETFLCPGVQRLRREMLVTGLGEYLAHDPAWAGDPHPVSSQRTDQIVRGRRRHLRIRY